MPTTYDRSFDEWLATLRDTARHENPSADLGDLLETAADDLATYHAATDDPYPFVLALVPFQDHYRAAVEEASHCFSADNNDPLNYIANVAWAALYLWFHDRLWCAVHGSVPDARLADPDTLT